VRITILQIKLVHTLIFWFLSFCVVCVLYSGVAGRTSTWTWVAAGFILVEGVVLAACGWKCPLTILAERQGAVRGSVTDIFLPKRVADQIFPVCGTLYVVGLVLVLGRLLL
jgi:hypothetical protein